MLNRPSSSLAAFDNARPLNVFLRWKDTAGLERVYTCLSRQGAKIGHKRLFMRHLSCVVANLVKSWSRDESSYVSYSRNSRSYRRPSAVKEPITRRLLVVIDALAAAGLVENNKGFRFQGLARWSRMRMTAKLLDLLTAPVGWAAIERLPAHVDESSVPLIELRDDDGLPIAFEETSATREMRCVLMQLNELLAATRLSVRGFPKDGIMKGWGNYRRRLFLDLSERKVRRIFNRSWDRGGRFYGGFWQQLPRGWRQGIEINGELAVEVDYSALHPTLVYLAEGHAPPDDMYTIDEYAGLVEAREIIKLSVLSMFNSANRAEALAAIRWEINKRPELRQWLDENSASLEAIIDAFLDRRPPLRKHAFSGIGLELQSVDACMANHVIAALSGAGVPVLPVHDSFLVARPQVDKLKEEMAQGFKIAFENWSSNPTSHRPHLATTMAPKDWDALTQLMQIVGVDEPEALPIALGMGRIPSALADELAAELCSG